MGLAVGNIGMKRDDFLTSTPDEFNAIVQAWNDHESRLYKNSWEQTRYMALCMLTPYSKKSLKATDLVRSPWEDTEPDNTKLATREDFEKLKKKYG